MQKNFQHFGASKKLPYGPPLFKGGNRSVNGLYKSQCGKRLGSPDFHPAGPQRTNKRVESPSGPRVGQAISRESHKNSLFRQFRFGLGETGPQLGQSGPKFLEEQKRLAYRFKRV